ncbi:hypothetical protein L917_16220 [Phytophthora nicotianae]|uniref:Uncharacterized protein n=1 Tax=Phytophthora nicotianae TaxID=4792 RepID=W2KFP5_PHYNI|nr:hypothetical protein L917_16220 [Phytophthora nicotianae]
MATPGDDHEIAAAPPTNTTAFFKWCQQHLQNRGWGRLDQEATRFLRSWGLIQRGSTIDVAGAIRRLLDAVPQARITKPRLIEAARQGSDAGEAEWVLPGGVTLTAQPTYQMITAMLLRSKAYYANDIPLTGPDYANFANIMETLRDIANKKEPMRTS